MNEFIQGVFIILYPLALAIINAKKILKLRNRIEELEKNNES